MVLVTHGFMPMVLETHDFVPMVLVAHNSVPMVLVAHGFDHCLHVQKMPTSLLIYTSDLYSPCEREGSKCGSVL